MAADPPNNALSLARPLVIGVGNRDRGDDGIGPLVAQAFDDRWPERAVVHLAEGDLSDLLLRWRTDQSVVIVDAIMSGQPPGTISVLDGLSEDLSNNGRLVSSHGVGIAEVIALAKILEKRPAAIAIVGIEAAHCEHFTELSPPVAAALPAAVAKIRNLLDRWSLATIEAVDQASTDVRAVGEAPRPV